MGFFSRLEDRSKEVDSLLCIGLDPHLDDLSSPHAQAAQDFCLRLVESTSDSALAYKPNIAFFEYFGSVGIAALESVFSSIPPEIPVILDAKRGDIASSAFAYAKAAFETLGAAALTVNPYLGHDAIAPFLEDEDRGVFLLCKTSNPGAADIQDQVVITSGTRSAFGSDLTVYELVAKMAMEWNQKDNLGLVVGATHPGALARVRKLAPELWILSPGIGAQGGDITRALHAGIRPDGMGMIVPVSRGISRAENPKQAAEELRVKINQAREFPPKCIHVSDQPHFSADQALTKLAGDLLETGCVKFGEFQLKSGLISPIYIDLRRLVAYPHLLDRVAKAFMTILGDLHFDHLAGLPYAGLPIATAISLESGFSLVYPRKETKSYGTRAEIEGVFSHGERVVLIDDLVTTGGSKFEAIEKLASAGLTTTDVVVLIDRQSGASEALTKSGFTMHTIFTLTQLLEIWDQADLISKDQALEVQEFICDTGASNSS